jgi:hypothetical protein
LIENRKSARHDVNLEATFTVAGTPHETRVVNLSVGGALVQHEDRIASEERVELSFRIPTHEQPIVTGAVVRWCGEGAVGIQFDGLRAKEVWALNKYFESLSS